MPDYPSFGPSRLIDAAIAQIDLQNFMQDSAERWSEAEPIGHVGGMFLVVPPNIEGWQVFVLDQHKQLHPISPPLIPGFVYRVKVEAIEPFPK